MRLDRFDYRSAGAYFVTICAYQRQILFNAPEVRDVIVRLWKEIPQHFPTVSTDSFVVMPNHVHGTLFLAPPVGSQHAGTLQTAGPLLSTVIRSFKAAVTREVRNDGLIEPTARLWQSNFYDRVIRDEAELDRIRLYIANNPAAWAYDYDNPECESNAAYVAEWGWLEGGQEVASGRYVSVASVE